MRVACSQISSCFAALGALAVFVVVFAIALKRSLKTTGKTTVFSALGDLVYAALELLGMLF
jgi:hypothetical protein